MQLYPLIRHIHSSGSPLPSLCWEIDVKMHERCQDTQKCPVCNWHKASKRAGTHKSHAAAAGCLDGDTEEINHTEPDTDEHTKAQTQNGR